VEDVERQRQDYCALHLMQGTLDVPIYGRISVLKVFRPKGANLDLLFLLTERYKFCVLSYDNATGAFWRFRTDNLFQALFL
jgi:hypothetical protein